MAVEPALGDLWIKICGVTSIAQAEMVASCGADAIGLNFVPSSKRVVGVDLARDIVRAVGRRVAWVGVFANQSLGDVRRIQLEVDLDLIQLHGDERPEQLTALGPVAYKALRVETQTDLAEEGRFGGDRILVDSKVLGELGGTGHTFDWKLAAQLARRRRLVLAGGLTEHNVAEAVRNLSPFGVDTASGVESSPGVKDPQRTALFVQRARSAHAEVAGPGRAG